MATAKHTGTITLILLLCSIACFISPFFTIGNKANTGLQLLGRGNIWAIAAIMYTCCALGCCFMGNLSKHKGYQTIFCLLGITCLALMPISLKQENAKGYLQGQANLQWGFYAASILLCLACMASLLIGHKQKNSNKAPDPPVININIITQNKHSENK